MLWFLVLLAILIVVALLFGGFRKGTRTGGLGPAPARITQAAPARVTQAPPARVTQACLARAISARPSNSIDFSRISTLRTLPVTVNGNASTIWT